MNGMYGDQIGKKFETDGRARRYPGNTVIADVRPGCGAYDVMTRLRQMAIDAGFARSMILLPEDSYHMTVIRGLNDQVRTDAFWPAALAKNAPMTTADDYVSAAVASVEMPGPIRMKFRGVRVNSEDFRVLLSPADEEQMQIIRRFRDAVAEAIGLKLPGHDEYTCHITLAYTLTVPEGEEAEKLAELVREMEDYISHQSVFETTPPYMAYYDDMLAFSASRIQRS